MLKRKIVKILTLISLISCIAVVLVSCTGSSAPAGDPSQFDKSVSISIVGFENEELLPTVNVGIAEGCTVFDALKYAAETNNIIIDYSGAGSAIYVKGIGGLYEFDKGPSSGWVYIINDDSSLGTVSAGAYTLSDKDVIVWKYVT